MSPNSCVMARSTERINDYIGFIGGNGTLAKSSVEKAGAGALLASAETYREEMLAFIRALVETESPSLEKAAVDRCGVLLAETISRAGARVRVHKRSEAGDIIQADFVPAVKSSRAKDKAKPILLLGHFDTVWESGTLKSMPCREEKGRLYGPGVYDM